MRARVAVGLAFLLLGVAAIAVGLYNFNEFFFTRGWSTWDRFLGAMPLYATFVALPTMVGVLLAIDGRVIYRLRRRWTLQIHVVSNLIWLYATKMLFDLMSEPSLDPTRYQEVFHLVLATFVLFLVGLLIDGIPSRKKEQ